MKNLNFPTTDADREESGKKLKYLTLEKYADLLDQQEAAKGKPGMWQRPTNNWKRKPGTKRLKVMDRFYDHLRIKGN